MVQKRRKSWGSGRARAGELGIGLLVSGAALRNDSGFRLAMLSSLWGCRGEERGDDGSLWRRRGVYGFFFLMDCIVVRKKNREEGELLGLGSVLILFFSFECGEVIFHFLLLGCIFAEAG